MGVNTIDLPLTVVLPAEEEANEAVRKVDTHGRLVWLIAEESAAQEIAIGLKRLERSWFIASRQA